MQCDTNRLIFSILVEILHVDPCDQGRTCFGRQQIQANFLLAMFFGVPTINENGRFRLVCHHVINLQRQAPVRHKNRETIFPRASVSRKSFSSDVIFINA